MILFLISAGSQLASTRAAVIEVGLLLLVIVAVCMEQIASV